MKTATFLRNVPVLAGLSDKLLERVAGFGEQWTVTGLSLAAHRRLCPRLEQAQRAFRDARTIVKWPRPKRTSYDAQSNAEGNPVPGRSEGLPLRGLYRRYLVVDEINGYHSDVQALGRVGRVVYRAPGVLVFQLR
jgi:hypothetical protein